jgi:3-oxoacyl-[acyl-carrier protein] reductase
MNLDGKVALVTGGGTGIGRATSLALAARGAAVAVNYAHSAAEAGATVALIQERGGRARPIQADVARDRDVRAMVAVVVASWGGVDLLVNCAGTTRYIDMSDLDAVTDKAWDEIFAVNLKGMFYCARAVAPHMRERGGAIVNVTSLSGLTGDGSSLPYSVSKAAGIGLTRSLARALAPSVRVCGVAPGVVMTRWVEGREDHVRRLSEHALLRRTASPEDVAEMICALLAQDAMTGQTVVLDGGIRLD